MTETMKAMDSKIAKKLLLNEMCEVCIFNDDWEHPHNGSLLKSCKLVNHTEKRLNNGCKEFSE